MKILAIRGKNLASLAGEFEVDFSREPLKSAGVFAITGQTGAGKSTLLDALSLALFHNTPRLNRATDRGVNVPDVNEETLSQNDPRHILRRGAGEGYAEVDFLGVDRMPWRARWQVRRAREKADGKLQQPQVSLIAIESNHSVGRGKNEVAEAICLRLGLSFDQFRRAVVLAQNEFAEFLSARSDDRADLLEALTGTRIYARISELCFERYREENKKLEAIKAKLDVEPPLSAEQRAELEAAADKARKQSDEAEKQLKLVNDERQWHLQGEKLRKRHAETRAELTRLEADRSEREADARLVAQHELAEQARPKREQLNSADQQLSVHRQKQAAINSAVKQTAAALSHAAEQANLAQQEAERASKAREQQAPGIKQARELDEAIRQSLREQQDLVEKSEAQQQDLAQAKQVEQKTREQLSVCQQRIDAWQTWLDGHSLLASMAADWPELGRLLSSADNSRKNHQQAEQAARDSSNAATAIQSQIEEKQKALDEQTSRRDYARQARDQAQEALEALDISSIEREAETLFQRHGLLDRLTEKLEQLSDADARLDGQQKHQAKLGQESEQIQQRLGQVQNSELPAARDEHHHAEAAYRRASLISSELTEKLRAELVDGEPCPVCGATDHSGHIKDDRSARTLIETLETQMNEARQACEALETELAQLKAKASSFEQASKQVAMELQQRQDQHRKLSESLVELAERLCISSKTADSLRTALPQLRENVEQQSEALQAKRIQLDNARQAQRQAEAALRTEQKTFDQCQNELEQLKTQAEPVLEDASAANTLLALRERELNQAVEALQKALSHSNRPEPSQIQDWLLQQREGETLRQAATKAEEQRPLLYSQLETQTRQIEKHRQGLGACKQAQHERQLALDEQRKHRAATLQAEDVEAYAKQLDEAEKQAANTAERTKEALGRCQLEAQRAAQDDHHWQQRLKELELQHQQASAALRDWFAEHHQALDLAADDLNALLELIDHPSERWQSLREALKTLDQAISEMAAASKTIAQQLDDWKAEARSQRSPEMVEEALVEAEQQAQHCRDATAEITALMNQDDERIKRIAGHQKALDQQAEITANWARLNDLIGSADGKKFKNYAQRFTLDVLIAYANQQLTNLAPRYRLKRSPEGLGILVVDQDMGGEVRGVHSLSGGETFLASLGLALGLAALSSQRVSIESLFIDEGFGSLDADTLRVAMDALDRLQSQGRKVGVISHVQEMSDRIGVQIQVKRDAGGRSTLQVTGN